MKYWFIYRNYFPSKGCFYDWKETKGLYDEKSAKEWFRWVEEHMKVIQIVRPPQNVVDIRLPVKDSDEEEDREFAEWLSTAKIEPRMWYVIDQILDSYYYGIDSCFHLRKKEVVKESADAGVVFTMREVIDWIIRTSPIQVRTFTEKDTQKVNFTDWHLGSDVMWVKFKYNWKDYETNFFWLYWAKFREAIFPNSNFNWHRLMRWQRDSFLNRGMVTIIKAPRSWGKSLSTTAFVSEFLFKELNMPHEYDRPFLIIYGWLSKEANLQVVEYLRAMAKKITTNKNILNWNKWEQILTLYDWHNERKIKFVSQGQEWQGFRWLRPHLVVLDEASRLSKEMYDVAAGTVEAPMIIISTTNKDDKKNWFEDMYKQWILKQRNYIPVEELIKETWLKFWMHKIQTREELQKAVNRWVIWEMRNYFYSQRPIVSLKYTIYDVEYLTSEQHQEQIDKYMASWEDACLAELFNELSDSRTIFNTDWLIESNVPDSFDFVACAFDEAEEYDNPAFVAIWYKWKVAYVIHSEILDKDDYVKKYARIAELLNIMRRKAPKLEWAADMTRVQRIWLRELTNFVSAPEFPILYTSAKNWDVNRKRPFYLVPKEKMIQIAQDEFFKKSKIIFSNDLDIDWWLIEEISNFKRNNKWAAQWQKKQPDDQVNGMIMALFALYWSFIKNNTLTETVRWDITVDERYDKVLVNRANYVDQDEYKTKVVKIFNNFR